MYEQNRKMIDSDEWMILNSCRRAHGAGYQHGNRNGCLKGTRESVLNEIERWAGDLGVSPVFWLNGLAGTGKSTIAQSIAERVFADGRLGASFFCSRGIEDRSNLYLIFPTLAFQLAQKYPAFRKSLIPLLRSNADVVHESLLSQMQRLIVEPLLLARVSTVVVIDALDECRDEDPESAILLVLGQLVSGIPEVKFFITSRPERHIASGFRGPLLKNTTNIFILHQVERSTVDNDIRHFFKHELAKLARQPGASEGWPTDEQVDSLCRRAAGFFVYAVATVKFLTHKFRRPSDRLKVIIASPEITVHEGQTGLKVYNSLDSLYASILRAAFLENDPDDDAVVRSVLSAVLLVTNPLSPSAIADLMGFESDVVLSLLESVQSLLVLHEDTDQPTQPFHKSFPDFMTDPSRCSDPRFYMSPDLHTEIALRCLGLMYGLLEKNMFSIPDYALNSDVEGLSKVGENGIDSALEYACRSWSNHLVVREHLISDVLSALHRFLEEKFVFWLELLSVLGAVGEAARALITTLKWMNRIKVTTELDTLFDTATDCLRFVTEFFEVISESASHIYHSALPLAPTSSIIRKLYSQQVSSVARVVTGTPTSWDLCTAIAGATSEPRHAIWSPCGQYVAASLDSEIEVRDSTTLEMSYTLKLPGFKGFHPHFLAFSPEGHLLICAYRDRPVPTSMRDFRVSWGTGKLVAWDIRTGVVIKTLDVTLDSPSVQHQMLFEFAGRVHTFLRDGTHNAQALCEGQNTSQKGQLGPNWTHEGSVRFVTSLKTGGKLRISIREFRPTPSPSHPVIESYDVPRHPGQFCFSPVSFHASFVTPVQVIILGVRDSNTLLLTGATEGDQYSPPGLFSPDGCFFACRTQRGDISVWEKTLAGYTPWSVLQPRLLCSWFSFSPTTTSILTWGPGGIQLLRPENHVSRSAPKMTRSNPRGGKDLVTSSTDGAWIATAQPGGHIITLFDSLSGTPQLSIDAGPEIQDMKFVRNDLLVLGGRRLARWSLVADGAREMEVVSGIPTQMGRVRLSNDGTRVVIFSIAVHLYDVESRQISNLPQPGSTIQGLRFSPCGSQVRLWSPVSQPFQPSDADRYFVQVEIEGRQLVSSTVHIVKDTWSLLSFLQSLDGFFIGRGGRWVEDSRGRKVFWLRPDWRVMDADDMIWEGNSLVGSIHGKPILIQFSP
ncbi:hypothetical protein BJ322DRAFT_852578 [Thelephora terrestris]|uniref:NACHT domain-containing protein n=1 Tax=Thelephora terrestris TaxID=56493 RepID=A0A9P6HEL5_9AGAM|nr:hypothetical protein BJ322DRAFT_852578 [Thelephora terrestris]